MRGVSIHFHFKYDAVVLNTVMYDVSIIIILPYLDIPLVRVLDIIQAHVVAEPPVVLLAVEDVPNLPGELWLMTLRSGLAWQDQALHSDSPLHCRKYPTLLVLRS